MYTNPSVLTVSNVNWVNVLGKLCVIFVFLVFQLSFGAIIEVSMFFVLFKHYFFLTSLLISSLGCHSRIPCFVSIVFLTWLKVESGCFSLHLIWWFPNMVFDFLIRLSWSFTLLSLDTFSNVTHSWKRLFFIPFAIVFFQLVLGPNFTFSVFHSQKVSFFPNCYSTFLNAVM